MATQGFDLRERPWQPGLDDTRFNQQPRNPNFTGGPSPEATAYQRANDLRGMSATERPFTQADARTFGTAPTAAAATGPAPAVRAGQMAGEGLRSAQSWAVGDRAPASTALGKARNIGAGGLTALGRGVGVYDAAGAFGDNFGAMRRLASDDNSTLSDYAAGGVEMVGNVVANGAANLSRRFPVIGPAVAGFLGNDAASRLVEFGNPGGSVLRRHGLNDTGLLRNAFSGDADATNPPGQPTAQPTAQPTTQPTAQPTAPTNDITKTVGPDGRVSYSGSNIGVGATINGQAPGGGGGQISAQNMAAADAQATRDALRSMGVVASQQQQAPMPPSIASPRPLTTHELRNLEVSAKSIMNTEKWGGKGADKNPDVIAYQNAMNAHIAQRNGMDPGTIARTQAQANMYGSQANADASRYASDNSLRGDMFKTAATERSTRAAAAAAAEKYRVERGDKAADRRDKATERLDKVFASYAAGKDGKTDERQLADLRNNAQAFLGSAIEAARKRGDMATVEQLNTQGLAALADDPELMRRYVASNKADRIARNSWGGTYNATDNPGGRQITKVEDGKVHFSDGTTAPRAKIEYANDGVLPHRFADWDPFASRTTEFDALDPRGALRKVNP